MRIKAVKGMKDILPGETEEWRRVEESARRTLALYGFREIRVPIVEESRLFARTLGEGTDVVSKEMYTFKDKSGGLLTLRPEATASIARAYVEHRLDQAVGLAKLYTLGPMFRTERPQAGRQRQFHQLSVEAIGSPSPGLDVEVIVLLSDFLREAGLETFTVRLNTVGCGRPACRPAFVKKLGDFVKAHLSKLGPEARARYPERVWRILDSKDPACRRVMERGPSLLEHVRTSGCGCMGHFEAVRDGLDACGQAYVLDPFLVRGLDYYVKTAFEVTAPGLGAQDAVAAGGRYDGLVKLLDGPAVGGVGMAVGLERLLGILPGAPKAEAGSRIAGAYVALLGERARKAAWSEVQRLRRAGVTVHMSHEPDRSLKSQLREADRLGCRWAVMLGDREIEQGEATVKDLTGKAQWTCPLKALGERLASQGGKA